MDSGTTRSSQPHLDLQQNDDFAARLLPLYRRLHGPAASLGEMRAALGDETAFVAFLEELLIRGLGEDWPALPGSGTLGNGDGTLGLYRERQTDVVKELQLAAAVQAESGARVIVCGHTHVPDKVETAEYSYFNTGSWIRYLEIGDEEDLQLADLEDPERFPYQLSYLRVTPGAGGRLDAELVVFEEDEGTAHGNRALS